MSYEVAVKKVCGNCPKKSDVGPGLVSEDKSGALITSSKRECVHPHRVEAALNGLRLPHKVVANVIDEIHVNNEGHGDKKVPISRTPSASPIFLLLEDGEPTPTDRNRVYVQTEDQRMDSGL